MIDRVLPSVLGVLLVICLGALVYVGIDNAKLTIDLSSEKAKTARQEASIFTLNTAINEQNRKIEEFKWQEQADIDKSRQALAEIETAVQEEERRILGIRGAQKTPESEKLEVIRQKMLKDALL